MAKTAAKAKTEAKAKTAAAPKGGKTAAGRRRQPVEIDEETQEDVLLDEEAIDVDTDEEPDAADEDEAEQDEIEQDEIEIKPRGTDAERAKLKEFRKKKKKKNGKHEVDDRVGPLAKLKTSDYLTLIMPLHVELLKLQNWIKDEGVRVLALFEGRDAAGKGGTIKRFIEHMNPRGCRVVALDKPSDRERTEWYFQRYVQHLPSAGEIVLFDRSWYNRAMVERVMGFCTPHEVKEFLRSVPEFERMLIRSDIVMFKFYFSVSKKEQLRRFTKRDGDPLKQWKLSPVDRESQGKWEEDTGAKAEMFFYTSTASSPSRIITSHDKKRARINAIRTFLGHFDYPGKREELLEADHRIVRTVQDELGVED